MVVIVTLVWMTWKEGRTTVMGRESEAEGQGGGGGGVGRKE
jgi:hypothetical protein